MIMKLKNIFNTLSLAAVALVATGCQDTDAQIDIQEVDAPSYVSVTPAETSVMLYGEKTITVTFDKNIGFATKNTSKITLNGKSVKFANVTGVSKSLTIKADVDFSKTQKLHIPAGLVIGPQQKAYDKDIDITWTVKDLPDNDATKMTQKLGWGWNLGNHFDTSGDAISKGWGYWDGVATITAAPFNALAAAGAKTVRMPVTWTDHMDDNNVIAADYLTEVSEAVQKAVDAGLNVIVNTHHDSFETALGDAANDEAKAAEVKALIETLWTQVANKFKNFDDKVIFETFNEIHAGDNWNGGSEAENALLNEWNQIAVNAIRATGGNNATRWIGVAGYAANIDLTIANLVIPEDPAKHIMVGVHCYDPYAFCLHPMSDDGSTVQVNSWGHNANASTSVSGANEEYVIAQLYKLREAYIEKGIPCYLGEYGCVWQTTDNANAFRKYYLEFFCRAANLAGIPMFVWDNNSKGSGNEANGYLDHDTGAWLNDGATLVPMMVKACTSTDASYWFDTIWEKSPSYQGPTE
jgi:endoglucanase